MHWKYNFSMDVNAEDNCPAEPLDNVMDVDAADDTVPQEDAKRNIFVNSFAKYMGFFILKLRPFFA
jgi:hypothetical protein